jgi:hypothetical protein
VTDQEGKAMVDLTPKVITPPPTAVVVAPGGHVITRVHTFATFSTGPAVCVSTDNGVVQQMTWYPTSFLRIIVVPS